MWLALLEREKAKRPIRVCCCSRRPLDVRFGSKADIGAVREMSALPPKADIRGCVWNVKCHEWKAPGWQELSSRLQHWSVQPCVRPLSAARRAAGHISDSKIEPAARLENALGVDQVITYHKQLADPTQNHPVDDQKWHPTGPTSSQHDDLLPQHEDLGFQRRTRPE